MSKHTAPARRTAAKTPTTPAVVEKVQRITASKNDGRQASWVGNLQSVVDKKTRPPGTPAQKPISPTDNTANQRNPNNDQYYKSRGLDPATRVKSHS